MSTNIIKEAPQQSDSKFFLCFKSHTPNIIYTWDTHLTKKKKKLSKMTYIRTHFSYNIFEEIDFSKNI